jgi:hypothetical protein
MAGFLPLAAATLSAREASFGGALKPGQRVLRTSVEASIQQAPQQGTSPSFRKIKIATIVYSAVGVVERRAPKILVNGEAKRQVHVHPEAMMVCIDLYHPKF